MEDLSLVLLPRLLFIVSTRRPDLYGGLDIYARLKAALANEPSVEVYLDRREGERRSGAGAAGTDRRRAERRQQEAIDAEIHDRGWAVVKVAPDLHLRPRMRDVLTG